MTIYDFELGGAAGNAATTGNTGATLVTAGAGNTLTLSNLAGVVSGSLSLRAVIGATTNSCWSEYAAVGGTAESMYVAITLSPDGYNAAGGSTTLWQGFLADDTTTVVRINVSNAGALTITDNATAHTATLVADVTARYGTTIAVRMQMTSGTTTANGTLNARYYTDPYAAVGTFIGSEVAVTTWSLGAGAAYGKQRMGINSVQASVSTGRNTYWDYYVVVTGSSWITGPSAAATPTSNAGPDQYVQSGTSVTMAASGTIGTGGGAITGGTWTSTERPPGAATASYTATSPTTVVTGLVQGVWKFLWKATQSGGGLSDPTGDEMIIWVHPLSGVAVKPYSVVKQTGITREGTATTDVAALGDTDTATLLRWPDDPTGQTVTIVWEPAGLQGLTLEFDGAISAAGTVNRVVNHYLEDGTTLLDGPYNLVLNSTTVTPQPAGLDSAANIALGTSLVTRRKLVTVIADTA